jgi:acyl carrier protein
MCAVNSRIAAILTENLGVDTASVRSEATFEELDLDSLAVVEFIELIQEQFRVNLTDDDIADAKSIADLVTLLKSKGVPV